MCVCVGVCTCAQSSEEEEALKLLQLSKGAQEQEVLGDAADEELIVAEYESDDDSKNKSKYVHAASHLPS